MIVNNLFLVKGNPSLSEKGHDWLKNWQKKTKSLLRIMFSHSSWQRTEGELSLSFMDPLKVQEKMVWGGSTLFLLNRSFWNFRSFTMAGLQHPHRCSTHIGLQGLYIWVPTWTGYRVCKWVFYLLITVFIPSFSSWLMADFPTQLLLDGCVHLAF